MIDPEVRQVGATPRLPSGEQHEIQYGDQRAIAVEVGGGLRSYTSRGRDVLDGYGPDEVCPGSSGQILAPWPNRVEDGAYVFAAERHRLPLSEPEAHNAIHGLVRWLSWHRLDGSDAHVTLGCRLNAQLGYPWSLELSVRWQLDGRGLSARHQVRNAGPRPCPVGFGVHPYFLATDGAVDGMVLTLPGESVDDVDSRGLPLATLAVEDLDLDFRRGAPIGGRAIDHTFSALASGTDGRVTVWIDDVAAGRTTVWMERPFRYAQVFTGDTLPLPRRRRALSVEPMTCPANAFRTERDRIVLDPGEAVSASWGIEPGALHS